MSIIRATQRCGHPPLVSGRSGFRDTLDRSARCAGGPGRGAWPEAPRWPWSSPRRSQHARGPRPARGRTGNSPSTTATYAASASAIAAEHRVVALFAHRGEQLRRWPLRVAMKHEQQRRCIHPGRRTIWTSAARVASSACSTASNTSSRWPIARAGQQSARRPTARPTVACRPTDPRADPWRPRANSSRADQQPAHQRSRAHQPGMVRAARRRRYPRRKPRPGRGCPLGTSAEGSATAYPSRRGRPSPAGTRGARCRWRPRTPSRSAHRACSARPSR